MDLKDFIAESLRQIIEAVSTVQPGAEALGAYVNPGDSAVNAEPTYAPSVGIPGAGIRRRVVRMIHFDVAVVVRQDTTTQAGAGVLSVVSVGGSKKSGSSQESTSRIKFSVPVAFPPHTGIKKPGAPARQP